MEAPRRETGRIIESPFIPVKWKTNNHSVGPHECTGNHSLDVQFWQDLVNGLEKPMIQQGYIKVPDTPGLGVTLNDDECRKHLKPGTGYFQPTPMWDDVQSNNDRLFS
jgi:hypothetical protein